LIRVLRKKSQDEIDLFDGAGRRFRGLLTEFRPDELLVQGRILKSLPVQNRPYVIRLLQGLPRGSKFDFVIEKSCELGVDEIIPFFSEKNPIELTGPKVEAKVSRWQKLCEAASKQSQRSLLPRVEPPVALNQLGSVLSGGMTLAFLPAADPAGLKKALEKARQMNKGTINLVVGPESGFSDGEVQWLESNGALSVSLGDLTLRTETAGLAALSIVNYELGLL